MINQYPDVQFKEKKNRKVLYIFGLVTVISIAALSLYLILTPKGPVCGNGICDLFETPNECCKDCECWGVGEVCNKELNKCEKREIQITDERIRELVMQYFANRGKEVVSMNITSLITWENKLGKKVMVFVKDQDWFISVVVMEDERVFEFQT